MYGVAVAGLMAVSAVGLGYASTRVNSVEMQAIGRPSPVLTVANFGVAAALHYAVNHLVVPQLAVTGERDASSVQVAAARVEAWKWARWGVLSSGAGVAAAMVGVGLEQDHFGHGQALIVSGLLTLIVGTIATDVLEALGAWHGQREYWERR